MRGTLLHMLITDLSAAEIVLGKLLARVAPVLCVLACTLPMMELVSLVGGVDPASLLSGFVICVGMAILGCSLALLFSLWVGKTHEGAPGHIWGLDLVDAVAMDAQAALVGSGHANLDAAIVDGAIFSGAARRTGIPTRWIGPPMRGSWG